MLDVGCWTLDVGRWMLDVGCWTLDVGRWMLDVGCWTLDVGRWMLDVGCWTLDVGRWMFGLPLSWRVMGAWWPSRSSKPLSARSTGRGMFDSYPLLHFHFRFAICDLRFERRSAAS